MTTACTKHFRFAIAALALGLCLSGAKAMAEQVTAKIDGVKSVKNLLQIVPSSKREIVERADADVKDAVQAAFKANAGVKDSGISVASVNKGVVLLAGKAKSLQS